MLIGVTNCRQARSGSYVSVTMQTSTGEQQRSLGCIIGRSQLAGHGPHPLAIHRDQRPFAGGTVRQVELDGQVLQDCAAYVTRSRRTGPAMLLWQLLMIATMTSLVYGIYQSRRQDD